MKKVFTLALALMGLAVNANAATVDDIAVCKHSYVLCFDDWDNNGGAKPGKGVLFGNGFFLDVTGGSVATNKGKVDLSVVNEADDNHVTQAIADKYGADYAGERFNSWRLKNAQDVIAMRVTAKSKLIFFLQGNNKTGKDARIPKIATDAALTNALNAAPDADFPTTDAGFRYEWTAPDDMLIYIGSYNGDTFFSYLIVEANEAPGTPTVKVGDQKFEDGLWFREVTCKANPATEEGSTEKIPTIVTYTTDGTAPTAASPLYTAPIKCYKDMTVRFQAFLDIDGGKANADFICDGADNDGNVNFSFDAPAIAVDDAKFDITSPYAEQNGQNFFTLSDGDQVSEAIEGNGATLDQSAIVTAYTIIKNGEYGEFKSKTTSKDVYVLNPIKEKKTIAITAGAAVIDAEATAQATDGSTVYAIDGGAISADKMDFFVKDLTFAPLANADANKAPYQVPAGQEAYIQMSNTNIVFKVAAGDKVKVKVICSKNSCKNIAADDAEDGSQVNDRKCYVNVSGTNYCLKDAEGNETNDLKLYPDANVFEFELAGGKTVKQNVKDAEGNDVLGEDGKAIQEEVFQAEDTYYTFQKYSGTGNILISSIEITPEAAEPAGVDIASKFTGNWNSAETNTHNADGTITYNAKQWGGLSAWLVENDVPADWSEYSQIVFEFAEATTFATQPFIQYNDGTETKAWIEAGATKAVCNLEAGKNAVKQVALQASEDGTLTITKIYLVKGTDTKINTTKAKKFKKGIIYNLAGRQVDETYKGIVVVDGVKMAQ